MSNTTLATGDNLLPVYWVKKALLILYDETVLYEFAEKTPLPKGTGNSVYWNTWVRVRGASAAVGTEGSAQTAVVLSSRRVTATVGQYSRSIAVTDLAQYMYVLNADEGAQEQIRRAAKETLEYVLHTGIFKSAYYGSQSTTGILSALMSAVASAFCSKTGTSSTSNKQFQFPAVFGASATRLSAVSASAPSLSAKASLYAIRKAVLKLDQKNAMPMADGFYVGYAHVNFLHLLSGDPSWKEWNAYQNSKETMYKKEVGRTWRVRWVSSTLCPRYAVTAHSVNISFIFGQEAFGATEAFGGVQIYKVTGADKSDPADQLTKYSFKLTAAAAALNPSAGILLFTSEKL
jgi:N4-gp56 family major capsid protein